MLRAQPGRAALLAALVAAAGLGSACRPDRLGPDTIVVAIESAPEELDPRYVASAYGFKLSRLVFAPLIDDEAPFAADGTPQMNLAERIEREDDRTYLVTLRRGLRFHDGHPLTAEDVAYTYETERDPKLGALLRKSYQRITAIEVVDRRRVRFRLDGPHAPFLTDLNLGIVPRHILAPRGGRFGTATRIGAGPFRVETWEPDRIVLARHEHYHRGAPRPARLVFRTLRDDNARVLALVGGSADLIQNAVSPLVLDDVLRWRKLKVASAPSNLWSYVALNLRDPRLSDVRVRRAIAHALDRKALIEAKYGGRARLSTGMIPPGHWAYHAEVARYPYDPARARALLDEAGLVPGPDGVRLRLTWKTTTSSFQFSLCRAMAAQLRAVGIEVELRRYEFGTFFADVKRGNFQIYSMQIPEVQEPDLMHFFFHSSRIPRPAEPDAGGNRWAFASPELDRLLDEGRRELDGRRRKALYARAQALLARELPVIPLWHVDNYAVMRRDLEGYVLNPSARFGGLVHAFKRAPARAAAARTRAWPGRAPGGAGVVRAAR